MKAVIFDMDGVIVDSEHQWKLAEGPFFRRIVASWRDEDHEKLVGLSPRDLYFFLKKHYSISSSEEDFLGMCEQIASEVYGRRVTCTPGLIELMEKLQARGIPMALASSSPPPWIAMVLDRFGLRRYLKAAVSIDEAGGASKPAPDVYLKAAGLIEVPPAACIAIEDSKPGVQAAKAAGMRCVGLRNGTNSLQDLSSADGEIRGFDGMDWDALKIAARV